MRKRLCSVLLPAVLVTGSAWAQSDATPGDPARGKQFFETCQGCHGARAEGNQAQGAPRLAGQHGWYLVRQLRNFRKGLRGASDADPYGELMANFARALPDDQALRDVAAYITTLDAGK